MPLKNIVVKNYTVVYGPMDTGEKRVPDELQPLVDEIYYKAQKGKPSIKKKLDKLLSRYPEVPSLWNHLIVWYEATGDMERAKQVNDELFKRQYERQIIWLLCSADITRWERGFTYVDCYGLAGLYNDLF